MPFEILDINYTKFSTVKSALLLFRFLILSLIRSLTIGSGTSFLFRWSLQSLNLFSQPRQPGIYNNTATYRCQYAGVHTKTKFTNTSTTITYQYQLTIGSYLACVYRVMNARGKFGEHEKGVRVVRGAAERNSSFLSPVSPL